MTLLEEIYEAAAQAAPSGADEELLQRLCRISAAQWQARLKAGVTPEDCREVFICAAAWSAAAGYFTQQSAASWNIESFTVREDRERREDRAADAGAAIDAAGTAADAPVLQGGGFCVRGGARMKALIESILQGYGSLVTVRDGQSARTFRALVQPVTEKGWASTRKLIESLGRVPKGQYVYIGPAEMEIKQGQTVEVRQEAYVVRRSETMALGDETLYVWALLTKAGGAESWNS